ncbi:hypothetical protein J6TS2_25090 [Heyndrickxia sporothermodurans]|nr:hypothetical protein J6TS2_25090 [Heyndrickxia sporothermodurans]
MKKGSSFIKIAIAFILFIGFVFSGSSLETKAATKKAKITQKTYKGKKFLKYPKVSGINKTAAKKINATINNAVKKSYRSYQGVMKMQKEAQKNGYCNSPCKYYYNVKYKVKYNTNGKLSIYYYDSAYTGGAHSNGYATVYNFNLSTGKQYKINDILKKSANYKKVQKYAYNYLSKHKPYKYFVRQLSAVQVNKNTQFSFAKNGIYLVFQEYEVASYADGTPFIKIPSSVYK